MALASADLLDRVARLGSGHERHDGASASLLRRSLEEYSPRRRSPISSLLLEVDGRTYPTLYEALVEPDAAFDRLQLRVADPSPPPTSWEFVRPLSSLELLADGSAELASNAGGPVRGIARFVLREHFQPGSGSSRAGGSRPGTIVERPDLFSLPGFVAFVRSTGTVPFALAVTVYLSEERVRYELDLLDTQLELDPRAGRLATDRFLRRTSRLSFGIDSMVARGELTLPSARALEVLAETAGLTSFDIAPLFGGVRELGRAALDALVARGLASFDRRTGVYRPRLEAFLSPAERLRAPEPSLAPLANPQLRTSVLELLAAAESRATCPLCGEALTPGHQGILCANCTALVDASSAPPA